MLEKLNGFCRGGVMEVDIWVGASGKNGIRRDWLIRSDATGEVLARATRYFSEHPHPFFHGSLGSSNKVLQMLSRTWAMMNQQTRRLSKMPEAIRAEISPQSRRRNMLTTLPGVPTRLNNNSDKLIDLRAFPCAKLCKLTKPSNARR